MSNPDIEICDECGHEVRLHNDPDGCQYECGDRYESGFAPMAGGPCGCTAWTVEILAELPYQGEPGLEANREIL
jgi:hypothetical protein